MVNAIRADVLSDPIRNRINPTESSPVATVDNAIRNDVVRAAFDNDMHPGSDSPTAKVVSAIRDKVRAVIANYLSPVVRQP